MHVFPQLHALHSIRFQYSGLGDDAIVRLVSTTKANYFSISLLDLTGNQATALSAHEIKTLIPVIHIRTLVLDENLIEPHACSELASACINHSFTHISLANQVSAKSSKSFTATTSEEVIPVATTVTPRPSFSNLPDFASSAVMVEPSDPSVLPESIPSGFDLERKTSNAVSRRLLSSSEQPKASFKLMLSSTLNTPVIEFFANGDKNMPDLTEAELFPYVKAMVRHVADLAKSGTNQFPKLTARDIRKLDDTFLTDSEQIIAVRQHVILLNLNEIRAVILRDRCFLILPEGADAILDGIMDKLQRTPDMLHNEAQLDFEFRALETILESSLKDMRKKFQHLNADVNNLLGNIRKATATRELEQLRQHKAVVNKTQDAVAAFQTALSAVLDDDQDLCLLHLSKFWKEPGLFDDISSFDHEDAEILLETYLQEVTGLSRQIVLLQAQIESTERLITLRLNISRNRLLTSQMTITLLAVGSSIVAGTAGVFGTNLNSHVQTAHHWFRDVIVVSTAAAVFVVLIGLIMFRYLGLLRS